MKSISRNFNTAALKLFMLFSLVAGGTALPRLAHAQGAAALVGVWYMENAGSSNKIAIQNDGTYSKLDIGGNTMFWSAGTFAIYPGQGRPILRLNILQCGPRQPFGCPLASENYMFEVDTQELRLWDQNGGPYILHRIQ